MFRFIVSLNIGPNYYIKPRKTQNSRSEISCWKIYGRGTKVMIVPQSTHVGGTFSLTLASIAGSEQRKISGYLSFLSLPLSSPIFSEVVSEQGEGRLDRAFHYGSRFVFVKTDERSGKVVAFQKAHSPVRPLVKTIHSAPEKMVHCRLKNEYLPPGQGWKEKNSNPSSLRFQFPSPS